MRYETRAAARWMCLALVFCLLALSGCSWHGVTGNGVRSYEQVKPCLPTADRAQLEQWEKKAQQNEIQGQPERMRLAGAFFIGSRLEGPFRGYRIHLSHKTSALPLLWGGSTRWWDYWEPRSGHGARPLVHRGLTRGFFYPVILARHWYEAHALRATRPIALKSRCNALLGLISYSHFVVPQGPRRSPADAGRIFYRATSPTDITFLHHRGFQLVYGLLGAADRNGRAYLQLLFFQIPLWSTG